MKATPSPKLFLMLTAGTILLGGGAVYLQVSALGDLQTRTDTLKKEVKDEKTVRADLAVSQTKVDDIKTKLAHLEEGLPDAAYVPTMLKELESTGKQNGIEVLGVRPTVVPTTKKDLEAAKKPYEEIGIEIKGRGRYEDVLKFLKAMNTFPKIVATKTVSITPKTSTDKPHEKPTLDVSIEVKAFLFKKPKVDDAKDKATPTPVATLNHNLEGSHAG